MVEFLKLLLLYTLSTVLGFFLGFYGVKILNKLFAGKKEVKVITPATNS